MRSIQPVRPRPLLWLLLLLPLAACLGEAEMGGYSRGGISDPDSPGGGDSPFLPGLPNVPGAPGTPGSPGTPGDTDPTPATPGVILPNRAKLTALSNHEFLTSVSELVGVSLPPDLIKDWSPSPQYSGFEGINWTNIDRKFAQDRILGVEKMVEAALGSAKVMTCTTTTNFAYATCGQSILERIARRAFRRPLLADEKAALKVAFDRGISDAQGSGVTMTALALLKEGVRAGLSAIFLSPQFMTRGELPPSPGFVGERRITAYELATRLAFLFRGAIPDDELFAKAESGELLDEATLDAQIDRLITTDTFAQTFMAQWYGIHDFARAPAGTLESAMWLEAKLTFLELVRNDAPVNKLLDPGFTYLVPSLASHYGIPGSFSTTGTRVATKERGGMLMLGAFLTATSPPLLTSPIRRGRFVQGRVLCKTLPLPGPELQEAISESVAAIPPTATVKERLSLHRNANSVCYGCHQYMDPIGLGLEGFDPTGKTRTHYDNDPTKPVETDSDLLGTPFQNFQELNALLTSMPEVSRCAAEKLAVLSLGRVVSAQTGEADQALVDVLSQKVNGEWPSLREIAKRIVRTPAFQTVTHEAP